jgi:hypothetical protein
MYYIEMRNNPFKNLFIVMFVLASLSGITARAADTLDLEGTAIRGSRELPKVLYIVPWKNTRLGALAKGVERSSYEEGIVALDREVYQREVSYFGMLQDAGETTR